jgi:hypothetical protein
LKWDESAETVRFHAVQGCRGGGGRSLWCKPPMLIGVNTDPNERIRCARVNWGIETELAEGDRQNAKMCHSSNIIRIPPAQEKRTLGPI